MLGPAAPAAAAPGPANAPEYWFDRWQLFHLWDQGIRGQGVTIAEIDTGVNASLPELSGRVVAGTDLGEGGNGEIDRDGDTFGHGTAMASIMVARPGTLGITGMAPDARVMPVAVPLNGTTDSGRPDRLASGIRYAADHGAKIISMSLGGERTAGADPTSCPDADQAAIFHALRKGAIVLASVGNTGPTRNTVEEPAVCLGVVSVGALTQAGTVAGFSAREPYLTLTAPGVNIPSLGRLRGSAFAGDGTSQATAIASAAAALVWSRYPSLTGRQVVTRLLQTLDDRPPDHSNAYGYGKLDTLRAVTADVDLKAGNPVYDAVTPFLRRDAALRHRPAATAAPAPAATGPAELGTVRVGSRSWLSPALLEAGALIVGGLLVLLLLAVAGTRRHRARRRALAALYTEPPSPPSHPRRGATAPAASVRLTGGIAARPPADAQPRMRCTARLQALITARSDDCVVDSLIPTPHSTWSPISISR